MSNRVEIKNIFFLMKGTYQGIKENNYDFVEESTYNQYNYLLDKAYELIKDEYIQLLKIKNNETGEYSSGRKCQKHLFLTKILPAMEYIYNTYIDTTEDAIKKVGALYNAIEDNELQKRCGDILSSEGAFDRVINQATQILEDRIKKKAGLEDSVLIGLALVSKAIHSKLEQTILKFSEKDNEQEDWSLLFKGIIGIYRNPTHHGLDYECTREEALKICAYIDTLLQAVEKAEKII